MILINYLLQESWHKPYYGLLVFIILSIYIGASFQSRYTTMALKYIKGHIVYFQASFVAIYICINIYFKYLSNYIPDKLNDTGLSLAIYLIFIGVLIDIIHKYLYNKDEYYSINKNEQVFIICICMIIMIIIEFFNKEIDILQIIAILLGKFFWIDTGIGKIKNTSNDKNKKVFFIKKIIYDIIEDIGNVKSRIKEIAILIIIGELTYYLVEMILIEYLEIEMNFIILCMIVNIIGLLIVSYGTFMRYIKKNHNISNNI